MRQPWTKNGQFNLSRKLLDQAYAIREEGATQADLDRRQTLIMEALAILAQPTGAPPVRRWRSRRAGVSQSTLIHAKATVSRIDRIDVSDATAEEANAILGKELALAAQTIELLLQAIEGLDPNA